MRGPVRHARGGARRPLSAWALPSDTTAEAWEPRGSRESGPPPAGGQSGERGSSRESGARRGGEPRDSLCPLARLAPAPSPAGGEGRTDAGGGGGAGGGEKPFGARREGRGGCQRAGTGRSRDRPAAPARGTPGRLRRLLPPAAGGACGAARTPRAVREPGTCAAWRAPGCPARPAAVWGPAVGPAVVACPALPAPAGPRRRGLPCQQGDGAFGQRRGAWGRRRCVLGRQGGFCFPSIG